MDGGCVRSVNRSIVSPVVRGFIGSSIAGWTLARLPTEIAEEYFATIATDGGTISTANQTRVTTLLNALYTAGIYRKVRSLYLYHGNTLDAARHNAINPGTHPGSMSITWTGSPALDADGGFTPTATDYGVPDLHPDGNGLTEITGGGLGFYSTSNAATSEHTMGVYSEFHLSPKYSAAATCRISGTDNTGTVQDLSGFHFATREPNSSTVKAYRNGTAYMTATMAFDTQYSASTSARVRVGGMLDGASHSASTTPVKLSIVTQGLTATEVAALNTAVQAYIV